MKVRINREQALAEFGRYTMAMRERYDRVHKARSELIGEAVDPTVERIKERAGLTSTGTVHKYLEVILALEGTRSEATPENTGPAAEPFADAIAKLTSDAKAQIDGL